MMLAHRGGVLSAAAVLLACLLSSCGGGGDDPQAPAVLELDVRLTANGTLVDCRSSRPTQASLVRATGSTSSTETVSCPSTRMLTGDFALALWEITPLPLLTVAGAPVGTVRASTALPAPVLVRVGDQVVAMPDSALDATGAGLSLENIGSGNRTPVASSELRFDLPPTMDEQTQWRWTTTSQNRTFVSAPAGLRAFSVNDLGFWGAMALADPAADGGARFFPADNHAGLPPGQFTIGRRFRDLRYVDLNNDGLTDIVSNVYDGGCVMIAVKKPTDGYDVRTPTTSDGACIGGHGETILVADFDNDGLVDVFLPTYERFYLLRNLGAGEFEEVAEARGISFPDYTPRVEGAAAVDIDLDGDVDMVVASEVLINDGSGQFVAMSQPFGPSRVFDEGMSVADVDVDGRFDIVKHHPEYGPRVFWGSSGAAFQDAGWLFGGAVVSQSANGVAVGDLTGNGLPDFVLAGGMHVEPTPGVEAGLTGEGPRLCMQTRKRQFECLHRFVAPVEGGWSDLVMVSDVDGDGFEELVARYSTLRIYSARPPADRYVFRFDLRDSRELRTAYGRTVTARCETDGSLLGMKFVDGGNGFMAQTEYVLSFRSDWCNRIRLETGSAGGPITLGRYDPGSHAVTLPRAGPTASARSPR
jgi:hypothetical protein